MYTGCHAAVWLDPGADALSTEQLNVLWMAGVAVNGDISPGATKWITGYGADGYIYTLDPTTGKVSK